MRDLSSWAIYRIRERFQGDPDVTALANNLDQARSKVSDLEDELDTLRLAFSALYTHPPERLEQTARALLRVAELLHHA